MPRLLVALAVSLLLAGRATAAPDRAHARELFRQGQQHFKLGEYSQALDSFREGYRLYEDPSFLYNIGQCHRQLGHTEEAIRFFRTYLHDVPDAANAAEVRQSVERLEAQVAAARAAPSPSPATRPPEPTPIPLVAAAPEPAPSKPATPIYKRWWLWGAVGVVAAAAVGVGLGVALYQPAGPTATTTDGLFHPF